jgi:hypothetical protein
MALCDWCVSEKGDEWVKAWLWRWTNGVFELAVDRACGIDEHGRLAGEHGRMAP